MFQKVLIFALLLGIASCLPYKQELLERMRKCETQLKAAKVEAEAHGFNIYQSGFDKLLVKVEKLIAHAIGLKDNTDVYDDMESHKQSIELQHQIDVAIKTPFPREHLKANALCLWAVKEKAKNFPEALRLLDTVNAIVEKENSVSTSWKGSGEYSIWKAQSERLDEMYASLEKALQKNYVPSFESHWRLINKAKEYMKGIDSKLPLYEQIRSPLQWFQDLTISMARQFPIRSWSESVDVYRRTCYSQISWREELQKLINGFSLKEKEVTKLTTFQNQVSAAIEQFRTQGLVYYAEELNGTLNDIKSAVQEALELPEDVNNADELEKTVRDFEREIPTLLVNPDSKVAAKAKALYLAASKIYPNPSTLVDAVKDIVKYEEDYYHPGPYPTQEETAKLNHMYEQIMKLISGFETPTQADFEKVLKTLRERVPKFEASFMTKEAKALESKLDAFGNQTREMNGLLPIWKGIVNKYFKIAAAQYETYKALVKLLGEPEPQPEVDAKPSLYRRLEEAEKQLLNAMEKYERRGANAYALILKEIQIKVQITRQGIEKEPVADMAVTIKNLEEKVASRVANPNPDAQLKADALYLAAMKVKSDPAGSLILTKTVTDIVSFESTIAAMTDRVQLQSAYSQRDLKYTTLENLMKKKPEPDDEVIVVVSMDDSEKLAESATLKVKAMKEKNRKQEAEVLEKEISQMGKFRMNMGALLPLDKESAVDDYYGHALRHQIAYVNIQKLMK